MLFQLLHRLFRLCSRRFISLHRLQRPQLNSEYRAIEVRDSAVVVSDPADNVDEGAIVVDWLDGEVGYAPIDGARIALIACELSIDDD